ncbi:MAG: non-heme iron oxygenase ferredoxin subunit [Rhizobiales bacterium]|nr:non-heme iron oxygenase ferredoxin subunit [Hyphomicrobiales bacterium]
MTVVMCVELCGAEDIPQGEMRQFIVEGLDGAVAVANVDGEFFAFEDCCTHGAASLSEDGELAGHTVECGWHRGQFDIRTGAVVASPCTVDLRTYKIDVREGRLHISF